MSSNVVDGQHQSTTDQTTVFATDATVVTAKVIKPLSMNSALNSSSTIYNAQDIKTFLEKPVQINNGVLSTTDSYSTFVAIDAPSNMFSGTMVVNKLDGFLGYRCTLKFRIVFNATRFQMGRYMLAWVPSGGMPTTTGNFPLTYTAYTNTLTQRTQLQRVEFDLSCDTEATIEIPYTSCLNYIPTAGKNSTEKIGNLGRLRLYPYVPLTVDSGTPTVGYVIYGSMHDVELVGAAVPQAGPKSRVTKRGSPSEQEQKDAGIGPVQSVMKIGLDVSSALAKVPILSEFALPASWIFDALHGTAAHFGWSKPTNLAVPSRMNQVYAPYLGSVDEADSGFPLSAVSTNFVDPALGFSSTDIDELDFKTFCTIPAYISQFTWPTSSGVSTLLASFPVSPSTYFNSRPTQLPGALDYTPICFAAQYFKYWRGSMVFRFKIVRTEFHSGRLSFAFFPNEFMASTPSVPNFGTAHYVNRHIVDIRESNEVVLTIPYVNSAPWLELEDNASTGTLAIYVEDKLVAPSTVPQLAIILVEVAGGPDTEFSVPIPAGLTPGLKAVPQSGEITREVNVCNIVNANIGGSGPNEDDVVNSAMCIGEKVSSFRALVRHFNSLPQKGLANLSNSVFHYFVPFGTPWWTFDVTISSAPHFCSDLYGTLSSIFLFSRGGVRLKGLPINIAASDILIKNTMCYLVPLSRTTADILHISGGATTGLGGTTINAGLFSNGPKVFARMSDGQPWEITVPQYHRYHSRVNQDHITDAVNYTTARPSLSTSFAVETQVLGATADGVPKIQMLRAGADDCNFGVFISIPPMVKDFGGNIV